MKNWPKVEFGTACEFVRNGFSVKQDENSGGYPITRIETIALENIDPDRCGYAGIEDLTKVKDYVLRTGDILISHINSLKHLGKCAIYEGEPEVVIHGMNLLGMRTKPDILYPKYAVYLLRSADFRKQLLSIANQSVNQCSFSVSNFRKLKIPLPPLAEQIHIAQVLDQADRLRQQDRQLLAHYDQLVQAVFMDMFGDPVRNEKGWQVKPFGFLGEARLGKMLDARKQTGTMRFPYLGNSNVQWGEFKLEKLMEMDFSDKDKKEFNLQYGDLLICEGGEVGRTAIWKEERKDIYFQKALHRVRLKSDTATPEYVQHLLWFFAHKNGFKDVVNVATIAHLTGEKLRGLKVPLPPFELQRAFSEITGAIEAQRAATQQLQAQSEALFNSLLQQAFRGELTRPEPTARPAAGQLRFALG